MNCVWIEFELGRERGDDRTAGALGTEIDALYGVEAVVVAFDVEAPEQILVAGA